jgi:MFS family permease
MSLTRAIPNEAAPVKQSGANEHMKVFYGWWIVIVAGIGLGLGYAPIIVYIFSLFIKPLTQEFHSSRASISLAFKVANLLQGFGSSLTGRMADRFGARKVIVGSSVLFALLLGSAHLLSGKLWSLYIFCGLLGFVSSGPAPLAYVTVVSRWFDRRRGLALGLMLVGIGSGAMLIPALAQRLNAMLGWRSTFMVIGLLAPCGFRTDRHGFSPEEMGLLPDGAITAREATE